MSELTSDDDEENVSLASATVIFNIIRRPRRTWLRTIEQDLGPLNTGLVSAWQPAQDRERRKRTVELATLGHALGDDDEL